MTSHHARSPMPVFRQGTRIADRYVLVNTLGEGGMGQVFEVEHEAIGRHFALKVLNINPCTDETLRRFQREARALGRITTPRVAQVTDFGYEPGLGPFYVMELLDGETLEHRLEREHHIPAHIAIPIAIDLCEALAEVHSAGIIHRDLKPSNVGLVRAGPMRVKLLDFGLAAAADAAVLERITRSQEVVGSLPYMAPERFHNAPLTLSIDLYALGVVLFEMLTGELPFQGTSAAVLINQHLNEPPPSFNEVAPKLHLPASLEAVVARLLDKQPNQRFTSAAAVSRALQAAAVDVTTPTMNDEAGTASTAFPDGEVDGTATTRPDEEELSEDSLDRVATVDAPGEGEDEDLLGGPTEVGQPFSSLKAAAQTGAPSGIPTSIVPGAAATPSTWPRPVSPTQPLSDGTSPKAPPTFAQQATPPGEYSGESWASGSIPPTTFEPSDVFPPVTPSRQWLKITAIVAAGMIGSTLAAVLAILLLDDDRSREVDPPPTPAAETLTEPAAEPTKVSIPAPRTTAAGIEVDHQKTLDPPTPPAPPITPHSQESPPLSSPHKGLVSSPGATPHESPDGGARPEPVKGSTKVRERPEPLPELPPIIPPRPPPEKRPPPPQRPWNGDIIESP